MTVTGVDDSLIDGSQTTVVSIAVVDESSNDSFDSLLDPVSYTHLTLPTICSV